MRVIKIGLVGGAGSGKDTVADYLEANYGFMRFAFARRMKFYFGILRGYQGTLDEIVAQVDAEKDRAALIKFGQTCREVFGADVWIRAMFRDMDAIDENVGGIVVTDVRQQNELEALRERGFTIVKVFAPVETRIERMRERGDRFDPSFLNHPTETFAEYVDADFEIDNGGKWIGLAMQCDYIVRELQLRESMR